MNIIPAVFMMALSVLVSAGEEHRVLQDTYQRLDAVREQKRTELVAYLQRVQRLADAVAADRTMTDFFRLDLTYFRTNAKVKAPEEVRAVIEQMEASIRERYLHNYMAFYDILCVTKDGDIFFTVRQEKDYQQNLFKGDLARTALAERLKSGPQKTFVDYEYYVASDEPSAFFVQPVMEKDELLGWFVLQCTMNKINSMFAHDVRLGATGEVILVNQQQRMLTDSRFFGEANILKRHLSAKNIEEKFREGKGHKIVTDYRSFRAITSFEACPVGTSRWLMIAKIDEDEVLTEEYARHKVDLSAALLKHFRERPAKDRASTPDWDSFARVDMDEFRKVKAREPIGTYGVSTCTAVVISCPGRFSYLAHLSNFDRIYGAEGTDLIGHMLSRIRDFDVCRSEIRNLRVTLIAPHLNSVIAATDELIKEGFLLSQIRFLHRNDAEHGTVYRGGESERTEVRWKINKDGKSSTAYDDDTGSETMGAIVKKLIGLP